MIPDSLDPANQAEDIAAKEDAWLATRPICADCKRHINTQKCLPIMEYGVEEYLCERCVSNRMVWTNELEAM